MIFLTYRNKIAAIVPRPDPHAERLRQTLLQELGPEILAALEDRDIVEVFVNPDATLWVSSHTSGMVPKGSVPMHRLSALTATIATFYQKTFTADSPVLEANLPLFGARYTALCPPVSPEGLAIAIRKTGRIFRLEADYVRSGILTSQQADFLRQILHGHERNIVLCGGTGTGKTALLAALLAELGPSSERIVVLEDTPELRSPEGLHFLPLRTSFSVDLAALVKTTLRLSPDRLIIGEVRGPEALNLLLAWNTGTKGGLATLHADTAAKALDRLELLVQLAGVPLQAARSLIASAVNVVVHLEGRGTSRRISKILEVQGICDGSYQLRSL